MVTAYESRDLRRSPGWQSREIIYSKNVSKMVDEKEANKGYLKRYLFHYKWRKNEAIFESHEVEH